MLNLPTLPNLPALPGESPNAPTFTPLAAADPLPGQQFNSVLTRTLARSLLEGEDPESADPIAMMVAPVAAETADMASIAQEVLAEPAFAALPALLIRTIIGTGQAGPDKTDASVTPSLTNNLSPLTAPPPKLARSPLAHADQTANPSYTGTMPASGQAESASFTAYSSHPDQSTTAAIFADSGKILPPPTPPAAGMSGPVTPLPLGTSSATPPAAASVPVTTAFDSPAWPDEFGQKITWIATQRLQSAELKLHPAHLGPIEIMLQLSGEQGAQQVSAQFASHHAAVREAIEANLPRLREMMAESGITLTEVSVSAQTSQQHANNGHHQTPSHQTTPNFSDDSSSQPTTRQLSVRHEGIINTFA
ncbi:MAG TPA: flagellar hook-length control protein FliK [Nitrosomonas halophila]|nr:flagellar hook-length control protein FliK [Nitrosomonas halophila]